jgi:hypothetical protein
MTENIVVDVKGCLPLNRCAELLKIADVVPRLMRDGIFASDGLPFPHFIESGHFLLVVGEHEETEILLTPLGQVWFGARYQKKAAR